MDDVTKDIIIAKNEEGEARALDNEAAGHRDNPQLSVELRDSAQRLRDEAAGYRQAADDEAAAESEEEAA